MSLSAAIGKTVARVWDEPSAFGRRGDGMTIKFTDGTYCHLDPSDGPYDESGLSIDATWADEYARDDDEGPN